MFKGYFVSPIGTIAITATTQGVQSLQFVEPSELETEHVNQLITTCKQQLKQYFSGELQIFHSLALAYGATDFQNQVWNQAQSIPYGTTITYAQLADKINCPNAQRAVGTALGANPLLLITPCHRITLASGKAGNFTAGNWRKQWLLEHEKQSINRSTTILH